MGIPMLADVKCPQCGNVIPINESVGEQKIDCPACGEILGAPGLGKHSPNPATATSRSRHRSPATATTTIDRAGGTTIPAAVLEPARGARPHPAANH
jgi:ribosomal protein S27E